MCVFIYIYPLYAVYSVCYVNSSIWYKWLKVPSSFLCVNKERIREGKKGKTRERGFRRRGRGGEGRGEGPVNYP